MGFKGKSGATFGGVLASMFGNASPFFIVAMLLLLDAFLIVSEKRGEGRAPFDRLGSERGEWASCVCCALYCERLQGFGFPVFIGKLGVECIRSQTYPKMTQW